MFGHVGQHALRGSRFQLLDRPLDGAALFPFFDDSGRTRAVMLLDGQTRRIVLRDWAPDLFERRWSGGHRLRLRFADLRDAAASDAERLGELWHFDPWWELRDARFSGHEAVPALQRTNVPAYDVTVQRLWFDRTLARVSYLASRPGSSHDDPRRERTVAAAAGHRLERRWQDIGRRLREGVQEYEIVNVRRRGTRLFASMAERRRLDQARDVAAAPSPTGWTLRPFWLSPQRTR